MKKIILIDLSSIAHPIWHTSQADANPDATSIKTVALVRQFAGAEPHVAVCCDSGRSFRKDIDPEYKANRPPAEATLGHQIQLAIQILKGDGFPVWAVPGFEADDLLASAADLALSYVQKPDHGENEPAFVVEILSSDKDLLQLVQPRLLVRSVGTGKVYDEAGVKEKLGVTPDQVVDWLALVGDKADNIIGAKGIGPVKATELLTKYGNLEDLYIDLRDHGTNFTPALATALKEFEPRLKQVRELITLKRDVKLPGEGFVGIFNQRVAEDAVFSGEDGEMPPADAPAPAPAPTVQPPLQFHPKAIAMDMDGTTALPPKMVDLPTPLPTPEMRKAAEDAQLRDQAPRRVLDPATGANIPPAGAPMPAPLIAGQHTRTIPTAADHAKFEAENSRPTVPDGMGVKVAPSQPTPAVLDPVGPSALAVIDAPAAAPVEWRQQLEPRSMQQATWLAEQLHRSRLFSAYGNAPAVLSTIMAGREFGLQTMAALRGFHIIEGRPSMSADLIRAMVLKSGLAESFRCTERTPTRATFVTKRRGEAEMTLSYTIEEARAAFKGDDRAWAASSWGKNPADMLVARAGSKLARLVYPDVTFGLYAPSELSDHAGVE